MWDLSSPTRDWTHAPSIGSSESLTTGPPGNPPKEPLDEVKEESEKADLKLNFQKTKIMLSGPITSWQIDGETMETVTNFIFLGSKIIADSDLQPWK